MLEGDLVGAARRGSSVTGRGAGRHAASNARQLETIRPFWTIRRRPSKKPRIQVPKPATMPTSRRNAVRSSAPEKSSAMSHA